MNIFKALKTYRDFQKHLLNPLETIHDFDIVREIGYLLESGKSVTLKLLHTRNIGSFSTINRRLMRLKRLGIVTSKRSKFDRRNVELGINPEIRNVYKRKERLLCSILCNNGLGKKLGAAGAGGNRASNRKAARMKQVA